MAIKFNTSTIANGVKGAVQSSKEALSNLMSSVDEQYQRVKESIGKLQLFSSSQTAPSLYEDVDEKHYFIVPFRLAEQGYVLHTMRVLPPGVPPLNSLPKKRIFHAPSNCSREMIQQLIVEPMLAETPPPKDGSAFGQYLKEVANNIDRVENKVTGGLLLVGGLVAIINPVTAVAIAGHALLPTLAKYGLNSAGKKLNALNAEKEVELARTKLLKEFSETGVEYVENPILTELVLALSTSVEEHDPATFDLQQHHFNNRDNAKLIHLTCACIYDVYADLLKTKRKWRDAGLGAEDIQWINQLGLEADHYRSLIKSKGMLDWKASKQRLMTRLSDMGLNETRALVGEIDHLIDYLLPYISRQSVFQDDKHDFQKLVFSWLPEYINYFLSMPADKLLEKEGDAESLADRFIAEMTLLQIKLKEISASVYLNKSTSMVNLGDFFRYKFDRSGSIGMDSRETRD
ncbi:hypothetical protein HCH_02180 [Hahella chejuensis KCTC 2396]|uniref:Uncharacterized protein n=1 Tax=Hahella chejuensis (strain KCTC 2396) TaxID=349521 RepID=Q2SK16_HAHCH|nr:hypothetical protein [Hahella chejuensis]ABC29008.1 hypothetical protein HCH_02180 [Hahella chejuensis KCTC 2396]